MAEQYLASSPTQHQNDGDLEAIYKSVGGVPLIQGDHETAWFFGWIPMDSAVDAHIHNYRREPFEDVGRSLSGSGAGRTVLLYKASRMSSPH